MKFDWVSCIDFFRSHQKILCVCIVSVNMVHPGFTLKNRDVQWFILHRQVTVMLFKATIGVVERLCMIMLFGVLPLYVLCHVLTCIVQETINYLILSYLINGQFRCKINRTISKFTADSLIFHVFAIHLLR